MAPATPTEAELFDLTHLVRDWAINIFYATAEKKLKKLKASEIEFKLIWDDVVCWSEPPDYTDQQTIQLPNCNVLFTTSYRNNTDSTQEYNFRTERTTRSTAEIQITKGFSAHRDIGVKLQLPEQILEVNAGFSQEISLSKATRQCLDQEMSWGIDTRVEVQANSTADVDVKIDEQQMTCRFSVKTHMRGRIRAICLHTRKNNAFLLAMEGDLGEVVEAFIKNKRPSNVRVEEGTPKRVAITTEGKCSFRFGVKQVVNVNQVDAPNPSSF